MSNINFIYKNLTPFKWYVLENFPFIEADFDALTNWQLFCKLGKEMNKIINSVNISGAQVETLTNAFNELQDYVNNYFNNLDIQKEVNNKLDEMVADGTFDSIVRKYYLKSVLVFDNIESLKNYDGFIAGITCKTLGYYNVNDGGGAYYFIRDKKINDVESTEIIFLPNDLVAELLTNNDYVNIRQLGAKGDGVSDDSSYLSDSNKEYSLNKGVFILDKNSILNNLNNLHGTGSFKFKDYNYRENDGIIPIDKIEDEIFTSMNLPSNGHTYMVGRINGNIIDPKITSTDKNLHGIGAVYNNLDENLPDEFNLWLGKIKVLGYRNSTKSWEILKDDLLPKDIRLYRLPWPDNISHEVKYVFDESKKMYKIHLTKEDFAPNPDEEADGYVIHFWGNDYYLTEIDKSDIIQLACYCECSAETLTGEDITNKLLGVSAIDIQDNSGNTKQAGYSRDTSVNSYKTGLIFHTIKNTDYELYNTNILYELFTKETELSKTLYEDLKHNSFDNIPLSDNIRYYKRLKIFYSFKRDGYDEYEYSTEIETNNNIIINTILEAKCYYKDDSNILNILTNTKEIKINNENIGNSNRLAIYEKLDSETNKLNQTGTYVGANYISINRIIGYIL